MKQDTLSIQGGFTGDSISGATVVPIFQTVSYAYKTAQELADVFYGNTRGLYLYNGRVTKLFAGRGGGLLTFGLGDKQGAFGFIDSLKLVKNLANLGDAKTLVVHPASTIFHEFTVAEQNKMGVTEDMVRVSVGIEDFEDIKAYFQQAIERTFKETK